jgi:hypothetical protein
MRSSPFAVSAGDVSIARGSASGCGVARRGRQARAAYDFKRAVAHAPRQRGMQRPDR